MIYKLLLNFNNFLLYFVAFFMICLLLYVIYKIFIIENDIYLLTDKVNKIEIEYSGGSLEKSIMKVTKNQLPEQDKNYDLNMNEIIMNNIFENNDYSKQQSSLPQKPIITEINIIDIDKVTPKTNNSESIEHSSDIIFDLKKDVITDDKESIISVNSSTKKKLLKLNLERLKEKCNEQGILSTGTKAQLIERLLEKEHSLNLSDAVSLDSTIPAITVEPSD